MAESVVLKSYQNGIRIYLLPDIPFEIILAECREKFKASAKFFKGSKLAVSFEGRELDFKEESLLIETIRSVCDIQIICIVGKDKETEDVFFRGIEQIQMEQSISKAQFFRGSLEGGERFETNESVIILGDVNKDAAVISKKDIIVLGSLYGEAFAGIDGKKHFVAALDFAPRKLKIADCSQAAASKPSRWGKKQKKGPMMAYVSEGQIVTKAIQFTEELLENLE